MRLILLHTLLLTSGLVASGCRGLQSEIQKAQLQKAASTAEIEGSILSLSSSLARSNASNTFDLHGVLTISADRAFPKNANVYHIALRPSRAGYYVMNFENVNGNWRSVDQLPFSGITKNETNSVIIEFVWKGLGGGWRSRPDAYEAFDVSVSISDSRKQRQILTTLKVPVTEQR